MIQAIEELEERVVPQFDNLEEAEAAAGFEIYVPTFMPEGFQRGPITVHTVGIADGPKIAKPIWIIPEQYYTTLWLEQSNGNMGPGGVTRPVTGYGTLGESIVHLAGPDSSRPADVEAIHWSEGEMRFILTGLLNDPVTENTLLEIAESVEPR